MPEIKFIPITAEISATREDLTKEFKNALVQVSDKIVDQLMKPTKNWEHKPKFNKVIKVTEQEISMEIFLDGESAGNDHYAYLDEGTKKHVVMAKKISSKTGMLTKLKMPKTFTAKTIPGTLNATGGAESEESTILPQGYAVETEIKARGFTDIVAKEVEKNFEQSSVNAVNAITAKLQA